jgi:hypothetical protein
MKNSLEYIHDHLTIAGSAGQSMSRKWVCFTMLVVFVGAFNVALNASEMRWVLLPAGTNGSCVSNTDCNQNIFCYGLEYTPDTTGTMTSYTTGFIVECLGNSTPLMSNVSCVLTDNSNQVNWCTQYGLIQFQSQANLGMFNVTDGVPVIIHQICLTVPAGTILHVLEDGVTDLTAAIDISPGNYVTEYPEYENLTISGQAPNVVTTTSDDGCGSLREMIQNATAGSTITFASALNNQTITLTSGVIDIDKDLTIQGLGVLNLAFSGNNSSNIFHITAGNDLAIKDLSLKDSAAPSNGGAVFAEGNLTLQNVLLKNNFENGAPKSLTIASPALLEILGTVSLKN